MDELSLITLAAAKSYTDEHGGGGGGTSNYNALENKPQIGGNELVGNKSASDLGLVAAETGKGLSTNDYTNKDKAIVGGVTAALANKADKSAVKNEFIGTLDEWNALTTEQKKAYDTYQIKGDYTEGSGGLPDYSTKEQKTGQKWIDGKDIYFQVLDLGSDISVGTSWYTTTVLSGDRNMCVEARFISSNGNLRMQPAVSFVEEYIRLQYMYGNDGGRYLVVFYTKTT